MQLVRGFPIEIMFDLPIFRAFAQIVGPLMSDFSGTSSQWWSLVLDTAPEGVSTEVAEHRNPLCPVPVSAGVHEKTS